MGKFLYDPGGVALTSGLRYSITVGKAITYYIWLLQHDRLIKYLPSPAGVKVYLIK